MNHSVFENNIRTKSIQNDNCKRAFPNESPDLIQLTASAGQTRGCSHDVEVLSKHPVQAIEQQR